MLSAQLGDKKREINHSEEQEYLMAVLHGDKTVLRRIYQNYLPPVQKFIVQSGGRQADALDVFQDALVIIYEKAKKPEFELTGTFFSYLYGVCRRVWGNRLQKKDNQTVTIDENVKIGSVDSIQPLIEQEERDKLFYKAFQKLGKDCQKLMRLFFEGNSMEEICEQMGHGSPGYSKKRKFQCKEMLTELVKSEPGFNELKTN